MNSRAITKKTSGCRVTTAGILLGALISSLAFSAVEALLGRPSACSKVPARSRIRHHGRLLRFETETVIQLQSTPGENEEMTEKDETVVEETEKSLLDKFNDFLDTPILDANNRSDQGAVAEVLKEFVRDEPEIAQVAFSVVVVALMVLATRVAMSP